MHYARTMQSSPLHNTLIFIIGCLTGNTKNRLFPRIRNSKIAVLARLFFLKYGQMIRTACPKHANRSAILRHIIIPGIKGIFVRPSINTAVVKIRFPFLFLSVTGNRRLDRPGRRLF